MILIAWRLEFFVSKKGYPAMRTDTVPGAAAISRRFAATLLLALCVHGCSRQPQASSTALASFLQLRKSVLTHLKQSFSAPPTGTTFVGPAGQLGDVLFPGDQHITSVVKTKRWQQRSLLCTRVLSLSEDYLKTLDPTKSDTFAPRVLLDHFFPHLENLGLRNMGSPGAGMLGETQYVHQIWFAPEGELTIVGQVVVDLDSGRAVVSCTVIESFD